MLIFERGSQRCIIEPKTVDTSNVPVNGDVQLPNTPKPKPKNGKKPTLQSKTDALDKPTNETP